MPVSSQNKLRAGLFTTTGLVAVALLTAPAAQAAPVTINTPNQPTYTLGTNDALTIVSPGSIGGVEIGIQGGGVTAVSIDNQNAIIVEATSGDSIFGIRLDVSELTGALTNSGQIRAEDTNAEDAYGILLDNAVIVGGILNEGIIAAESAGDLMSRSYGLLFVNGSSAGSLTNADGATISAVATAELNGTSSSSSSAAQAYAYAVSLDGGIVVGAVSNAGEISASADASSDDFDAEAYAYAFDIIGNSEISSFTNEAGGVLSATATANSDSGDATAEAYGLSFEDSTINGDLINRGLIEAEADAYANDSDAEAYTYGIDLDGVTMGAFINEGTITSDAYGEAADSSVSVQAHGVYTHGTSTIASFTNTSTGVISGRAEGYSEDSSVDSEVHTVHFADTTIAGAVTNAGAIIADARGSSETHSVDVESKGFSITSGSSIGSVTNTTTGAITVDAFASNETSDANATGYGIELDGSTIVGALTNEGTITVDVEAENLSDVANAYGYGLYLADGAEAAAIVNSGTITVTADSETTSDNDASSYAYGIYVQSSTVGNITNTSTINATATANAAMDAVAHAAGIHIDNATISGQVRNDGTINATVTAESASSSADESENAYGIFVTSSTITGGIVNTGLIQGEGDDFIGIAVEGGGVAGGIKNSGTIDASNGSYAIYLNNLSSATPIILDGGRIIGDVYDTNAVDGYSNVSVVNNFTTEGNFTVSDLTIASGKKFTIAPDNVVTLDTMSTSNGGILEFGVNNSSSHGFLEVIDNAVNLTGASVRAKVFTDGLVDGDEFRVATGDSAIVGGPGSVKTKIFDNSYLWDIYMANGLAASTPGTNEDLYFFISQAVSLEEAATTKTNLGASEVLIKELANTNDPIIDQIQVNLNAASTNEEYNEILEATTPTVDNGNLTAAIGMTGNMFDLADGQLSMVSTGKTGTSSGEALAGLHFWVQGFGASADQGHRDGVDGYEADVAGVAVGVDTRNLREDTVVGVSFGYGNADVDSKNANRTNTEVDSYQVMLYGNHALSGSDTFLTGMAVYGWNDNEQVRHDVGGIAGLDAQADYDTWVGGLRGSVGHNFHAPNGGGDGLTLTPQLFSEYLHFNRDGYQETGAGGANLTVGDAEQDILNLGISAQAEWTFNTSGGAIKPDVHVSYKYDVLDDKADTTASFAAGGSSFEAQGVDQANSTFGVGTGVKFYSTNNWDFTANYDYTYKSDYDAHSGYVRAAYEF